LKVVDGNCLLELWYRVNSICGATMNQRDTMLLLLAIATIISLKKKKKKNLALFGCWEKQEKGLWHWKKRSRFYLEQRIKETEKENLGVVVQKGWGELKSHRHTWTLCLWFLCLEEPKQPKKQPIQRKKVWMMGMCEVMGEIGGIKYMCV